MARILKMDLHTHPIEALKDKMGIRGILDINKDVVATIIKAVKSAGLDGIAITEHNNFNHGWVTSLELMDNFRRENLIILAGAEIDYQGQQFLEIYVPPYVRRAVPFFKQKEWFFILAHPGFYNPIDVNQFADQNFDAVECASLHGEFSIAEQISRERNIPVVKSSDAHTMEEIGFRYTEMESTFRGK
jgi:histidinol phosphatase-like PHP family hydrolase